MRIQGKEAPRSRRGIAVLRVITIAGFLLQSAAALADINLHARGLQDPVELSVTVTDEYGTPIHGLDASRFTITENGTGTPVTGLSVPPGHTFDDAVSLSAVFIMDYSGSLVAADAIGPVEEAVVSFIQGMNLGDRIALIKLNGTTVDTFGGFAIVDPADTTALVEAVRLDLAQQHGSHIFDAVLQAYDLFEANLGSLPEGPKAVVVLTDGKDVESVADLAAIEARVAASNVPLYPIGFGLPDVDVMTAMAQASGTTYVAARDADAFQQIQKQLADLLQNQYVLQYESAIAPGDCSQSVVSVTLDAGLPSEQTAQTTFSRCQRDNTAPTIQSISRKQFRLGHWVTLQVEAGDLDGDSLSFSATGLPPGLSIDPSTGLISGVPDEAGTFVARVSVVDGKSSSDVAFTIDVIETPDSGGGGAAGLGLIFWTMALLAAPTRRRCIFARRM